MSSGTRSGHRAAPQPAGTVAADAGEGGCATASAEAASAQGGVCLEGLLRLGAGCGGSGDASAHLPGLPGLPSVAGVAAMRDKAAAGTGDEEHCLRVQWQGGGEDSLAILMDYGADEENTLQEEMAAVLAVNGVAETGSAGAEVAEAAVADAAAVEAAAGAGVGGFVADASAAVASAAAATVGVKGEEEAIMGDVGEDRAGIPELAGGLREPRSEADWCRVTDQEWTPVLPEQVLRLVVSLRYNQLSGLRSKGFRVQLPRQKNSRQRSVPSVSNGRSV